MSKTIYVHVGGGKCGSSSIQKALQTHKHHFQDNGYEPFTHDDFPDLIPTCLGFYKNHSLPFEARFLERAHRLSQDLPPIDQVASDINKALHHTSRIPILSSEWFLDAHKQRAHLRLGFLKKILQGFDDIRIIYYFRSPYMIARSLYTEWFYPTFEIDFDDFFNHFDTFSNKGSFTLDPAVFRELIEDTLGKVKFIPRVLEKANRDDGLINDFCKIISKDLVVSTQDDIFERVSVRPGVFNLVYLTRDRTSIDQRKYLRAFFKNNHKDLSDESYVLMTKKLRTAISQKEMKSINDLDKKFGLNIQDIMNDWEKESCIELENIEHVKINEDIFEKALLSIRNENKLSFHKLTLQKLRNIYRYLTRKFSLQFSKRF